MSVKKSIIILGIAFAAVACSTSKVIQYEYRSTTMMGKRALFITQDSVISDYTGRSNSNRVARAITPEEWEAVNKSIKSVKLDDLDSLKGPTNERKTDASPYGLIVVTTADSVYYSATFDGYNAHPKLLPFIEEVKKLGTIR